MTIKSTRCALVCRMYWAWHSAKCVNFAECFGLETRQTLETLPGVLVLTLGKLYKRYRVFWNWNSAKFRNFAECFGLDTRQTWETLPSVFSSCTRQNRHHRAIPLTFFCRVFIDTRQTICRVRDKRHSANYCLPTLLMPCVVCRVLHSAKQLPSVFGPQSYCIP